MSLSTDTIYGLYVPSRLMDDYSVDERAIDTIAAYKIGYRVSERPLVKGEENIQIYEQIFLGQNYPLLGVVSDTPSDISIDFAPVNGIPFKMMFGYEDKGDGAYVANTTHVFKNAPATQARIPEYIFFKENLGGEVIEYYGCVAQDLSITQNIERKHVHASLSFRPHSKAYTTGVPASRTFPKTIGSVEVSDTFILLDTFTWNSESIAKTSSVSFTATRSVRTLSKNLDGTKQYLSPTTFVTSTISYTTANPPAAMRTDFKAYTPRTIVWKVKKANGSRYFEITLSNALIISMSESQALGEPTQWQVLCTCENIKAIVSDTVKDTDIDEPTES